MAGRPQKYDPITFPTLAEKYASEGLWDYQIADKLNVCRDSFNDYKKEFTELSDALKKGRDKSDIEVENALHKRATGFEFEEKTTEVSVGENGEGIVTKVRTVKRFVPPDTGAAAFWLKNRQPFLWREKTEQELYVALDIIVKPPERD